MLLEYKFHLPLPSKPAEKADIEIRVAGFVLAEKVNPST